MRPETPLPGPDWGRYYDSKGVEHHFWPVWGGLPAEAVEPVPEPIAVDRREEVQMQVAAAEILIEVAKERIQQRQQIRARHRARVGQPTLFEAA